MKNKLYTLYGYARYVLDDERVKHWIERFNAFQRVADRLIDACDAYLDLEIVSFTELEKQAMINYKKAMERAKNTELTRLIEDIHPAYWSHYKLSAIAMGKTGTGQNVPRQSDIPLIMFKRFVSDPHFRDYIFHGTVPLLAGPYFLKEIDLARQRYMVFAFFLWFRTDGFHDFKTGAYSYYDDAIKNTSVGDSVYLSPRKQAKLRVCSTIENRLEFLTRFKAFIHLDMSASTDYDVRHKDGSIMRLRVKSYEPGQIVVQECSGHTRHCNELFLVNQDNLAHLTLRFHEPSRQLTPFALIFRCDYCNQKKASLLMVKMALRSTPVFYCDQHCFTLKKSQSLDKYNQSTLK